MLGRDHALSGAVVFAAAAPAALHLTPVQLAVGTVLTAGSALLPDFDEPGSTIARDAGFLGRGFAHLVRRVARGHRRGTHSLLGAAVFTLTAWAAVAWSTASGRAWLVMPGRVWLFLWLALLMSAALRILPFARRHHPDTAGIGMAAAVCFWHPVLAIWMPGLSLIPVCVGAGVLIHIAGDELTHGGCPFFWPASEHDFHLLPVQFTTGKFFEHWIVSPLLTIALGLVLAHDATTAGLLAAHHLSMQTSGLSR